MRDRILKRNILKVLLFLGVFISADLLSGSLLLHGIKRFYGLDRPARILAVGHSHLMLAIDKTGLEHCLGTGISKYTREGVNVADRETMVAQYLHENGDSLKTVIYGVDSHIFSGEGLSKNSWKLFLPFMDDPLVAKHVRAGCPEKIRYYEYRLLRTARYNDLLINAAIRGWLGRWDNLKFGKLDIPKLKREISNGSYRRIEFLPENIKAFEQTLEMLQSHHITVVLVNTPTVDLLNDAEKTSYDSIMNYFSKIPGRYPNARFIDLNPEFSDQYNLFYDPIHMNPAGQKAVTERLCREIGEEIPHASPSSIAR